MLSFFFYFLPVLGYGFPGLQLQEGLGPPPGVEDFYSASREINRWYFSFSDLILVLGAISGLLGGIRIYANWQAGKHRIDNEVSGWFLACLFLSLIGSALKALYGVR
ncbi:MAG: DUF4134 family protein [Pseudosphingobacterium sp.]|nr:DUF4134 family protein [Pseudosphingobacterium sp.]